MKDHITLTPAQVASFGEALHIVYAKPARNTYDRIINDLTLILDPESVRAVQRAVMDREADRYPAGTNWS